MPLLPALRMILSASHRGRNVYGDPLQVRVIVEEQREFRASLIRHGASHGSTASAISFDDPREQGGGYWTGRVCIVDLLAGHAGLVHPAPSLS